jgi:ribosomal subunit interface protein
MDVEIQTQHIDMQPEWRAIIEQRLERLGARYPEILRVHVTVRHGGHHRLGTEEVDIVANCAGGTLRAAKQEGHVRDAVHAALDALERELAAHHETRRHVDKPINPWS